MSVLFALAAGLAGSQEDAALAARKRMVATQIESRGVRDPQVLKAMSEVPRHLFVPAGSVDLAYEDHPLPIGEGQTISQPYIVALMTERLALGKDAKVLEIGTGSGYQAAVLAKIAARVFTIEIHEALARQAAATLERLGVGNVRVRAGDGFFGWPEEAPFDGIIVTAAARDVPPALRIVEHPLHGGLIPRHVQILDGHLPFAVLLTGGTGVRSSVLPEDQHVLRHRSLPNHW